MNLIRTTQSNLTVRVESTGGDLLILDAPEQEFHKSGIVADLEKLVPTSGLRECIAFEFSLIPQVAFVYTAFRSNEVFYAWIVIDEFEKAVRQEIYERQRTIIDEFPMFQFDFYVIGLMGRNVVDLIGDESMHLTYERPR